MAVLDRGTTLSVLALAALVLALIALSRTGKGGDLAVRVKHLEEELARLRALLASGARPAAPGTVLDERGAETAAPLATDEDVRDEGIPVAGETFAADGARTSPSSIPSVGWEDARGDADAGPGLGVSAGSVPPTSPAPSPGPAVPVPSVLSQIDWEQWLGVRGAAVLGGAALALAGLFFFRYSIEHGLIPPWLRVVLGVLTGLAAIGGAEWSLRKRYAGTANALAGGGLVILYAAFWAAGTLYELIPIGAVFVLMVLVTVAGCALSWRHASLVIAVIGLVGGFLTPVFASSGRDNPIGLFAYVMLLDAGILILARRMRWPVLGLLALAGTTIYQLLWIGGRMDADRVLLGLAILAVFAPLFAFATPRAEEGDEASSAAWRWSQRLGILFPLLTAIYFAAGSDLEVGILPLGALLMILGLAAGWLARQHDEGMLGLGAAAATLGVIVVWVLEHPDLGGSVWTVVLVFVALGAAHHVAVELAARAGGIAPAPMGPLGTITPEHRDATTEPKLEIAGAEQSADAVAQGADGASLVDPSGRVLADVTGAPPMPPGVVVAASDPRRTFAAAARAATVVGLGLLVLLVLAGALRSFALSPLLAGWLGLAAILVRQATLNGRGRVQIAAAVAVGVGLAFYRLQNATPDPVTGELPTALLLPITLLVALAWQGSAVLQARLASRRTAEHAAAAIALVLLLGRLPDPPPGALLGLGVPLVLGFLVLLAATRLGGGLWMLVGTVATALVQLGWVMEIHPEPSAMGLLLALASAALFAAWPLFAAGRLRDDAWSWRASAIAPLVWFPAVVTLFEDLFGDAAIGLAPLALGAIAVAAAARARVLWPDADDPRRVSALAWLCGAALTLVTVAIPMQLEKEWITIGWALEGAALVFLWTRLDHPGLKYTALALLLATTVRLIVNPEVLAYYPRPAWRIVNWLAYAYLVPAAALVASARLLLPLELPRLRSWERTFYWRERPLAAGVVGIAALLVVFVWINLAIADWFSPEDQLRLLAARTPAEKLVLSIAWAIYAVTLLALGVRLKSVSLRWASLVLLMVTIGKIFLYDLGELRDLYRVGALLGLALSLIVVSLVYQRFVFRRPDPGGGEAPARTEEIGT